MESQTTSTQVENDKNEQGAEVPLSEELPVGTGAKSDSYDKDNARIDNLEKGAKSTDVWMAILRKVCISDHHAA